MKYSIDDSLGSVRFASLPEGEVFVFQGIGYLKTPHIEGRQGLHWSSNCVKIGNGEHAYVFSEAIVQIPKSAELKIVLR